MRARSRLLAWFLSGFVCAATLLGLGSDAHGLFSLDWNAGTGDWSTAQNWVDVGQLPGSLFYHRVPASFDYVTIGNGGTAVIGFSAWANYVWIGPGALEVLPGGALSAAKVYVGVFGGPAAVFQSGGSVTLSGALSIYSRSLYDMSGGVLYTPALQCGSGSSVIGAPATFLLSGAAELHADSEDVGKTAVGTFTQTGGMNIVQGCLAVGSFFPPLQDGVVPPAGTYELSGGQLETNSLVVGRGGTGFFAQTGGTNIVQDSLQLGAVSGAGLTGTGRYELSGTGVLQTASLTVGYGGSGTFVQTGGANTVNGSLQIIGSAGGGPGATGSYTIGGGSLEVHDLDIGTFGQGALSIADTSAEITVSGTLRFGPGATFSAVPGSTIHFKGPGVQNECTNPAALSGLVYTGLVFESGNSVATSLEAACAQDRGFPGNFALGSLQVGGSAAAHVQLVDAFDNGNRKGGRECIYTSSFTIAPNSTVDTQGLRLYGSGDHALYLRGAIADGRLRDTTVTGKDRLDAVYDPDPANNWTLVARRVIRNLAGVPEYKWRRGCAPTSAAMIMAYWSQIYPNMWPGIPPYFNNPADNADPVNVVIEHLGDLMGTDSASNGGGTITSMIPGAMTWFALEKGYYNFVAGNRFVSDNPSGGFSGLKGFSFEYLEKEIDAGHPMHIGLRLAGGGDAWHSVVAYGYQDFPGTYDDYIAVMDTWGNAGYQHTHVSITSKNEDEIEWWKWTTDTTQSYYIYRGAFFSPGTSTHEYYSLLESSFQSAMDFQEGFTAHAGAGGAASVVTLANKPQESALRMEAVGSAGPDDCIVSGPVSTPEGFKVSFLYAFETAGTLQLLLDGTLLAELTDATGLGQVDDHEDFRKFSQEFSLLDYGLDPTLCHEFSLRLLAGSDHVLYVDNLLVYDPLAPPVSEAAPLVWTGSVDNRWADDRTANWSSSGAAREYDDGKAVVFDDAVPGTPLVRIVGTVYPASVLVNNNAVDFQFGGPGSIAGPCRLTKSGSGTLILATSNTYTGGTDVSGGTLLAENATGSATGTGAVTVGAATLGGTGFIGGPVTLTGDSILTSTGTLTINNTLTVQGLANQLAAGTVNTSGDVTIEPGAVFIINGTLGGGTGDLIVRGTLMGKGTINKPLSLEAGGVLSPGSPSTIEGMAQMVVGGGPQTLAFEIGAAGPNYASPANSANDVIRLTDAAAPFADATGSAAVFSADTVIDVYFLSSDPAMGGYKAEFFAATDFTDAVAGATYEYWRLDPRGSRYHNGNLYSPLDPSLVDWSVVPETAVFDGQAASGYITEFTVVPEPATLALVAMGAAAMVVRRRR